MAADRVTYEKIIYSRGNDLQVWKGRSDEHGELVIKVIFFNSLMDANQFYKEVFSMMRFKDIEGVAKIYDCEIGQSELKYFIRILMKFYKNGDLEKNIKNKAASNQYFNENELMAHLETLSNVFAYFQEKQVAHRDIKPENIFLDDDGKLVVGDLGCASELNKSQDTIAGTPLYLSPILKRAFLEIISNQCHQTKFDHDIYKSDVYSLGITFLYMVTLVKSEDIALEIDDFKIQQLTDQKLNQLSYNYPVLCKYLSLMLYVEEHKRIDFISLNKRLQLGKLKKCSNCKKNELLSLIIDELYFCVNCFNLLRNWLKYKYFKIMQIPDDYYSQYQITFGESLGNESCCTICYKTHPFSSQCLLNGSTYSCQDCNSQATQNSIWVRCQTDRNHYYCIVCLRKGGFNHNICTKVTSYAKNSFIFLE